MVVIFFILITFSLYFFAVVSESFTFEDEDFCEYKILLKVFSHIVKKYSTQKASLYHFSLEKLVPFIFIGEGLALSQLQND